MADNGQKYFLLSDMVRRSRPPAAGESKGLSPEQVRGLLEIDGHIEVLIELIDVPNKFAADAIQATVESRTRGDAFPKYEASDARADLCQAAVSCLENFASRLDVRNCLMRFITRNDHTYYGALLAAVRSLGTAVDLAEVRTFLLEVARNHKFCGAGNCAIEALAEPAASDATLLEHLLDIKPYEGVERALTEVVQASPGPVAAPLLCRKVKEKARDTGDREKFCVLLGEVVNENGVLDTLFQLCRDTESSVRACAVTVLKCTVEDNADSELRLIQVLSTDKHPDVRRVAADALSNLDSPRTLRALQQADDAEWDSGVRLAIHFALQKYAHRKEALTVA